MKYMERALDALVGILSPARQVERNIARQQLEVQRKYAAAKSSHWTPDVGAAGTQNTINDEIDSSVDVITSRILALVRDFPVFSGAVTNTENFVIGDGFTPQVLIPGTDGKINKDLSRRVEDAFNAWADNPKLVDVAGRKPFWEFQSLSERQEMEFGEYFFPKHVTKGIGLQLQDIEPSDIGSNQGSVQGILTKGKNYVWRGVEYVPDTLKAMKYWITTNTDFFGGADYIVRNADMMYHSFKPLRGKQLRGVTPFASAILMANMIQDYMQSELAAQNMASRFVAFVTSPDGIGKFGADGKTDYDQMFNKITQAVEYASVRYLPYSENFEVNTQQRMPDGMINFSNLVLKYLSVAITLPYEIVSQDYSELNYSILKAKRNDFKQQLKPRWKRKVSHFCQPVFEDWLKYEMLINGGRDTGITPAQYLRDPRRYSKVLWIPPGMEKIDPLKETSADIMQIMAGLKSPQRVIKETGGDPETVINEIAAFTETINEKGLVLPGLSTDMILNMTNLIEASESSEGSGGSDDED